MVLGFSKSASGVDASRLTFFLSIYAINGTWMGMQELTTQLFYCGTERPNTHRGGGSSSSTAWLNYGNNFRKNFQCDLSTLINEEPLFYELFVLDEGNSDDGASSLYPCPVLLKDYQDNNGGSLNRNKEKDSEDDDVFVRRFMLYDTLSSVSSGYEGTRTGPASTRGLCGTPRAADYGEGAAQRRKPHLPPGAGDHVPGATAGSGQLGRGYEERPD